MKQNERSNHRKRLIQCTVVRIGMATICMVWKMIHINVVWNTLLQVIFNLKYKFFYGSRMIFRNVLPQLSFQYVIYVSFIKPFTSPTSTMHSRGSQTLNKLCPISIARFHTEPLHPPVHLIWASGFNFVCARVFFVKSIFVIQMRWNEEITKNNHNRVTQTIEKASKLIRTET